MFYRFDEAPRTFQLGQVTEIRQYLRLDLPLAGLVNR